MRFIATSVVVVSALLSPVDALSNEVAKPLLTSTDIQSAAAPSVFQGVSSSDVGAIYFPDMILAVGIEQVGGDGQKVLDQWSKSHSFILIPFAISVRPSERQTPEFVDVSAAFAGLGELARQPLIIDSFPETGFKVGAVSGSGELTINADARFEPITAAGSGTKAGLGAAAEAALRFDYAPAYADVVSGFASGHAFWQFERTQDQYPVGEIPMKLLIGVPHSYKEEALTLDFDVRVRFSAPWWQGGTAIASYTSLVMLPSSQ